jgi:two-component system, NtrC family, sensor histidine kinase KinB
VLLPIIRGLLSRLFRSSTRGGRSDSETSELGAVATLSTALLGARDVESVGRLILDQARALLEVDVALLAMISEDGAEATGLVARDAAGDVEWWSEVRVDLRNEPSMIASAAAEAAPLQVFDVESSAEVHRGIAERVGAKSAVFMPLITDDRVQAVVIGAATGEPRHFGSDDLALLQTLAAEAGLALERARSAEQLEDALERERLVAEIGRKVRSEVDLDAVLRVAVEETGRAVGVGRCFIRLGELGEPMPILAEWDAPGLEPLGGTAPRLPVLNLAARERRTAAIGDVAVAEELRDPSLGSVDALLELGTRAVLATPIVVFDRMIGVFALHRSEVGEWAPAEVLLAEAVAREIGLAIHSARLIEENRRRLESQSALLKAAQALTSELRLEAVLQRLVIEATNLLGADAADCHLYDSNRGMFRCAAVYGFDEDLLEFEFPADRGLSGEALSTGRPARSADYGTLVDPVPHPAYEGFRAALVAPMTWSGEVRGVFGVGLRDETREFDDMDAEIMEAFASLASLALRNAASFEQSERQARVQRSFYRIAAVLGEPISRTRTHAALAQAASEAFGGSFSAVLMSGRSGLEPAGGHNLPGGLEDFLAKELAEPASPICAAARSQRVLSSGAVLRDERFADRWRERAHANDFRSLLVIPVDAGQWTGLAIVFFSDERRFDDDDLELARHLSRAARGALERSELFESERTSRALSQQLTRMGRLLAAELDPTAVLEELAGQAARLLAVEASSIRVYEGGELVVRAVAGSQTDGLLGTRAPATSRVAGDVLQTLSPVALADVADDERSLDADPLLAAGYRAYLGVPLYASEGGAQGVLSLYSRLPRAWREEEIDALVALAGTASAVLANAELYQHVAIERERSLAILENVADGIVATDRDGKVVLWNDAAERITGLPRTEALGRTPAQVLQRSISSPDDNAGNRLVAIRRGSEEVWLSLTEAIMRDPTGAEAGRIFAFRDVSADRAVEEMKSGFVSMVSQELRRPLTSIYGFAETLLQRGALFEEEERTTFLTYITSETERLTSIVDRLLNVARLDAGDLEVQLAPLDVRPVVSEAVASAERSDGLNGHRFVVDLPAEPLGAEADPEKLRQVLAHLLDNAVRYSPDGGTVTVAARERGGSIEVRVVDEGVGIPAVDRERIFRKFESRRDAGGGIGLGLFLARGLVAAMGGRIWVDPGEERGSSFVFELPATMTRGTGVGMERV